MPTRLLTVALLAAAALFGCGGEQPPQILPLSAPITEGVPFPLPELQVSRESLPRERSWDGVVEAVHQATLSAQTGGRVIALPYDVNDYVKAGEIVVRFTDVEQQAAQRQAQAAMRAAQAASDEADAEFKRIAEVFARQLVPRAQYEQALARRDTRLAQLEAARAALQQSSEQLDYTVIQAPYPGILTERHVQVGETVRPGQPLVSGLSLNRLRVNVDVPQSEVAAIREYAQAAIWLADGRRLQAESVTVFPFADPQTHTFRVRVDLPESDTGLQPGMTVKTAFLRGSVERLTVPASALLQRSEVMAVYVIDTEGTVSLRQIRLGHRYGDRVEVVAGLHDGERIAADPMAALAWLVERRREAGR